MSNIFGTFSTWGRCRSIPDAVVDAFARNCPDLTSVNLSYCPLLTPYLIEKVSAKKHHLTNPLLVGSSTTERIKINGVAFVE